MFKSKNYTRIPTCRLVTLIFVFFLTSGCASILKGTTQGIPISSDPSGADILVDGNLVGTTPTDVEMKRKRDHLVVIEKKDYHPKSVPVVKDVGGAVWGSFNWGASSWSASDATRTQKIYGTGSGNTIGHRFTHSGTNEPFRVGKVDHGIAVGGKDQGSPSA